MNKNINENECFGPQKIVTVKFNVAKVDLNISDGDAVNLVHLMLLGERPYPYNDPIHPQFGDIVDISCGDVEEPCAIWNDKNVEMT